MASETENQPKPNNQQNAFATAVSAFFAYWLVSWILIPGALVLVLHFYVFSAYHVVGTSMIPTLQNSDYLIVSKVERTGSLLTHDPYIPKREQVIVFHYPKQPDLDFVKRVIALPGERVTVKNCAVTVYNREHPEGFSPDNSHLTEGGCTEGNINTVVPNDNIFVLGDNRTPGGSSDSREWGFLPSNDIVGNAVLRLYPNVKIF